MTSTILESERLILRPFVLRDAPEVQQLAGDRAIADTTLNIPHPYADGEAESWIASHAAKVEAGELAIFAITARQTTALIGAIGLIIEQRFERAEMGYWIGKPYWGHGYCTEAARRILEYGFDALNLHRIHAAYLARNPASGRILEKIGMREEGTARGHVRKWGVYEDLVLCGLLRDEWQTIAAPMRK